MTQKIISPSTSVTQAASTASTGYDYTIGPQQTLPNEQPPPVLASRLYNESLHAKARKAQVSLSAFAFLFQEMISQTRKSSKSVAEIESKLRGLGYPIGIRLLELLNFRSSLTPGSRAFFNKASSMSGSAQGSNGVSTQQEDSLASTITTMKRRDLRVLDILQFIHGTVWQYLFDHVSDDLVKSSERENEYMIIDNLPLLTQFIGNNNVQCDSFVCGIIEGILDSACFPCSVTAHCMPEDKFDRRVVYLIKFDKDVLEREALRF
ncbi:LAFE_0F13278g1_1 [Lachancea fermentati]|uniref:Trafficking protein particle complex subunit n=1 Tax=Lachancea fermentati TaxID=4955 RepID=A0A1G4MFR2_LACFM|nr:LAFE_0F13278g1_1 [Lachancea fermentati]